MTAFRNFEWRRAVIRSPLPHGTVRVAVAIAELLIKKPILDGEAAKYESLASATGMTASGVRAAVKKLQDGGWLKVQKRGFGAANSITILKPQSATAVADWEAANSSPRSPSIRYGDSTQSATAVAVYVKEGLNKESTKETLRGRKLKRGWDDRGAQAIIGMELVRLVGSSPSEPRKIDGMYLDAWCIERMKASAPAEFERLVAACRKGALTDAEVADVDLEAGISQAARDAMTAAAA